MSAARSSSVAATGARLRVQGDEDPAEPDLGADLRQLHPLAVEALVPVHVGGVLQRPVEVVHPGVVGAGDDLAPAGAGEQRRHPVQADVRHRPDVAVVVAQHDHRLAGEVVGQVVAVLPRATRRGRRRSSRGRRCGRARRRSPLRRCRPTGGIAIASVNGRDGGGAQRGDRVDGVHPGHRLAPPRAEAVLVMRVLLFSPGPGLGFAAGCLSAMIGAGLLRFKHCFSQLLLRKFRCRSVRRRALEDDIVPAGRLARLCYDGGANRSREDRRDEIRDEWPARAGVGDARCRLRGVCGRLRRPSAKHRRAARRGARRAGPAAELAADRRRLPPGAPGPGRARDRLRRPTDAGAGARGGAARGRRGHGHRQPYPVRPERDQVLSRRRRDHQGGRGRHRRRPGGARPGRRRRSGARGRRDRARGLANATSRAMSTSSGRAASPAAGSASTSTAPPAATSWARRCAGSGRR